MNKESEHLEYFLMSPHGYKVLQRVLLVLLKERGKSKKKSKTCQGSR